MAIANIDTRQLTRQLRTQGAQNGCILALAAGEAVTPAVIDKAVAAGQGRAQHGRSGPGQGGLQRQASYDWTQTEWELFNAWMASPAMASKPRRRFHVVAYDFGVKKNILRMLAQRGCKVTVVPAQTSAAEVLKHQPDGIFLSNGPGDPEPCDYAIAAAAELIDTGIPTFGICLGHQIMALASRCQDLQDEVWPPRCQPPGQRPGQRSRLHHQPEPRFCGG